MLVLTTDDVAAGEHIAESQGHDRVASPEPRRAKASKKRKAKRQQNENEEPENVAPAKGKKALRIEDTPTPP